MSKSSALLSSYNPANWYWIVGGSTMQVYSSAQGAYVPVTNPTYVTWELTHDATKIDTEQNLTDVLIAAGLPGVPSAPSPSDTVKDGQFSQIPLILQKWALAIDNRVRVLEGQSTRTPAQFKAYVKSL